MIYWLTGTAGSSARIYREAAAQWWGPPVRSQTPMGVAVFPQENAPPIRRFAERTNNIVHWSEFDRGGHFAAMEVPELLVQDVRAFFRRFR
jgi:microsomal epoxide hydrolase